MATIAGVQPVMQSTGVTPQHVAIIMDGNGRWAQQHGLPRTMGHKKGAEVLRKLLVPCKEMGIKFLTLYAFSSENWGRPAEEVSDLMGLLQYYIEKEIALLHQHHIRLRVIGDLSLVSKGMAQKIDKAMQETAQYTDLTLVIALSYGSRQEITHAVRQMILAGIPAEKIDEGSITQHLYTKDTPDPDLLIRTGGEQRLSNFLLWQSAYTEFYFTPILWPDFDAAHLQTAVAEFVGRERRFGNI
jgi:undecaprenyl diphosphate synthase